MVVTPRPAWLVEEPYVDIDLGVLKTGKEAQIDLVERQSAQTQDSCLLAIKRYLPRKVENKGELEALGVQRSSAFRHDVEYREGRQFRKSRDRRAVERMSSHGKALLQQRWTSHEFDVMRELWQAGVAVPYPVSFGDERLALEYIGARDGAAPQLSAARLPPDALASAATQVVDGLATITAAGWAHGDLSAYNLLWWHDRVVFIDFPQAVDIAANPQGIDFLHRDVMNVAQWFTRSGCVLDGEEIFAELLAHWHPG